MEAIIKAAGKQYKVAPDRVIKIDKLQQDIGSTIELNEVLLVSNDQEVLIGEPLVPNCTVIATVEKHTKGDKVKVIKFKRRKHSLKRMGHRQNFTAIRIKEIKFI